jgi:hypothetical protein
MTGLGGVDQPGDFNKSPFGYRGMSCTEFDSTARYFGAVLAQGDQLGNPGRRITP